MSAGKGDTYRKVDQEKFSAGWDRIFGKKDVVTGFNNGLSQDYDKKLGRWFADRPGARKQLEETFIPKDANLHPSCAEPFCSCVDKCMQMEPIKPGDLHK